MTQTWKWKVIGTVASVLITIYLLVPSLFDFRGRIEESESVGVPLPAIASFFPKKAINLGLDLRGGMYLEMDVDLKEAMKNRIDILISEIERLAKKEFPDLKLTNLHPVEGVRVELTSKSKSFFLRWLKDNFGEIFNESAEGITGPFELMISDKYREHIHKMTIKQATEAVRNRIDRYGVVEASIQRQSGDRLIIELPGIKNPDRVIDVIRQTGLLEFKLVDDAIDRTALSGLVHQARQEKNVLEGYSKEIVKQINEALVGKIPEEDEVLFELERDTVTKVVVNVTPYLLKKKTDVTGDMLRNAQVGIRDNEPRVMISFNKIGSRNFAKVTKENVGGFLAIVLDNVVVSAPEIRNPILNGEGEITLGWGNYDSLMQEAEDLAMLLREGALPASLTIATKTVIGPSLGLDSIKKGLYSLFIAAIVIVIFMMVYYKLGGILANIALILNILYIFAILSLFQASLTLPGIAGIVLTMGMAVDANIIIFERMREEAKLGKTAKSVVESGYANAMSAIVDANITTLIAGIVLYQFGTGPIKGFATTLMIGIFTTLFTAIVVTRLVYDFFIYKRKIKRVII